MMEWFLNILKLIYHILEIITPALALPAIGLLGFSIKRVIDSYFQKNFLKEQERFERDLESYRSKLLHELEEYKIGIDTRKHLSIEMSDKRLIAYQNLLESLVYFLNKAKSYNENPTIENMYKVFDSPTDKGWDFLHMMESNTLFYSKNAWNHFQLDIAPVYQKIINKIKKGEPIDCRDISNFTVHIANFKEILRLEIYPNDPAY